jgi:hypothetical protein
MHYLHLVMKKEVATAEFMVIYLIYWHRISKCCSIKLDKCHSVASFLSTASVQLLHL